MPRCDMCFKEKASLQPPMPKFPGKVCKGCFYEIDRVVGFLDHYGFTVVGQTAFPEPKRKKKVIKPEKSSISQEKQ